MKGILIMMKANTRTSLQTSREEQEHRGLQRKINLTGSQMCVNILLEV